MTVAYREQRVFLLLSDIPIDGYKEYKLPYDSESKALVLIDDTQESQNQ